MRDLGEIERLPDLTDGVVRLRAPLEKDRADTVRGLNDEVAARFLYRVPYPYASEDFDAWVQICASAWGEKRDAHWTIVSADDDAYLGGVSLMIEEDRAAGELGYQVVPWARGRGVAAAAARLVRDWGLDELGLERLEIHADVDNIGSQRVALSLGMRHEGLCRGYLSARGVRRDYVLLAMKASDPRERRVLPDHERLDEGRDEPTPTTVRRLHELEHPPELTDGVVRLRAPREKDRDAAVAALNDELTTRFLDGIPTPYTVADFDAWIASSSQAWPGERTAHWHVVDARDDTYLGAAVLMIAPDRASAELGCQVAPPARGRGVSTAALRLVRDWAFDGLGLERLEASIDADNITSQRLATALGMRREGAMRSFVELRGERRDHVLFGMLRGDPREPFVALPEPDLGDGFVVVRPFVPDDAPAVAAACQDPLIQERCYFVPAPYRLDDARAFIATSMRELITGAAVHCAVCAAGEPGDAPHSAADRGDAPFSPGELLGAINLMAYPEREAAETGYWVKREARGRGVAAAALRLMIAYAFAQVGVERLELMTETPNVASQRLAEKLGFRREGVARAYLASRGERDRDLVDPAHGRIDQVLYALLRPEWETQGGRF
jgi:RimJ/RimL family protein N-acetyltransferase